MKKDQKALDMVQAKGDPRSNPWVDNESTESADICLKQTTAQVVQNLPPVLAQDTLLKALLQPSLKQVQLGDYSNVVPLEVNYGGSKTTEESTTINGNIVSKRAHKDKMVEYDKTKGFVTTSWANFMLDSKGKQAALTTSAEGLFIKHVTSTVINPNSMFKQNNNQQLPAVNVDSSSLTSGNLLSNSWTNVLLYTPKEQIFKINVPKGTFDALDKQQQGKDGH